jgi:hypothetical protein
MTVGGIVVAALAALLLGFGIGPGGGGDNETYRNREFGYQLSYPSDWSVEQLSLREGENLRLTTSPGTSQYPRVAVIVNLQGDWCTGTRPETRPITVFGVPGEESRCYVLDSVPCSPEPACRTQPTEIARVFRDVKGRSNYVIVGNTSTVEDVNDVRRIVESFRFVD